MNKSKKSLSLFTALLLGIMFLIPYQTAFAAETETRTLYNINVKLNDKTKTFTGEEEVQFKNKYKDELKEIVFHLYPDSYNKLETLPAIGFSIKKELSEEEVGNIDIKSVYINGTKTSFTQDNQVLKVSLKNSLAPGETIKINIDFNLKIPHGTNRLGYYKDHYSITNWYPILSIYDDATNSWDENPFYPIGESNYSDSSDYKVVLTVPSNIVAAATGIEEYSEAKDGYKDITVNAENVRDFDFFMHKDYKVISKEVDGIKVNSYYIAQDNSTESTAKRMLTLACDAISFFNKTFGKYPFEEFDIAESYLSGGAMEYPTIIQMGKYSHMSEKVDENNLSFFDEAVVHEVGHQWWYSTVGNNEFKESILDESFTSFSTALYFEKRYGEDNSRSVKSDFLKVRYPKYLPIYRSVDEMNWNEFGIGVYKLGAIVLEDLRQTVGEEKFLEIFRTYYDQYKFKNATFEGFLSVVEDKCGSDISDYVRNAYTSENYDTSKLYNANRKDKEVTKIEEKNEQSKKTIKNENSKDEKKLARKISNYSFLIAFLGGIILIGIIRVLGNRFKNRNR